MEFENLTDRFQPAKMELVEWRILFGENFIITGE